MALGEKHVDTRLRRIKLANDILDWLNAQNVRSGHNAFYDLIIPLSRKWDVEIYELWKAWGIIYKAHRRGPSYGGPWKIICFKAIVHDGKGNLPII